ncbi:MAG: fibronectin type III domain-containing protein, partial [Candidatus Scalinduaceae bacterium]
MSQDFTISQFIRARFSCFSPLVFISFLALILFVSTTNVYSAQVTLSWNANSEPDLAGYKLYHGTSSRNYDTIIDVGNKTSHTISNLIEGETYYIALTAYDIFNNESAFSSEVVYVVPIVPIVDTTPPSIPTSPVATPVSTTQIDLSWNASTDNVGVTGYRIYRDGSQVGDVSSTTYQDTGLSLSTTYTYTVSAYDAAGNESGQSTDVSATTLSSVDTTPPSIPTSPVATPVSTTQIDLSWNASTDNVGVTGYRIYRNGSQVGDVSSTTYQDTGLSPSTTYTYTVSAYDAAGNESGQSTGVSATTLSSFDITPPSIPFRLFATTISTIQIDLSWDASTDNVGVTGYRIYRDGSQVADVSSTTYHDTGLSPSTTYTYTVSAYDAAGNESGHSTGVSATTLSSNTNITIGDIDGNGKDDVVVDYGSGVGVWAVMNNSTWKKLHAVSPEIMTTADIDGNGQEDVFIDFGSGVGIWTLMNNSTW